MRNLYESFCHSEVSPGSGMNGMVEVFLTSTPKHNSFSLFLITDSSSNEKNQNVAAGPFDGRLESLGNVISFPFSWSKHEIFLLLAFTLYSCRCHTMVSEIFDDLP